MDIAVLSRADSSIGFIFSNHSNRESFIESDMEIESRPKVVGTIYVKAYSDSSFKFAEDAVTVFIEIIEILRKLS